jgi:hypothetical protein
MNTDTIMNKLLMTLMLGLGVILVGLGSGCVSPQPLTTVIEIETPSGTRAFVSSPKDTGLKSLIFNAQTGDLLVEDLTASASDPTAAFIGVMEQSARSNEATMRLLSELIGGQSRSAD